jgi:sugar phosphate isomerase/epimerase
MRFAICNELLESWPLDQACRFFAETGYEALEIAPFTLAADVRELTPDRRRDIKRLIRGYGLGVTGLHWLLARTQGMHVCSADPEVVGRTLDYLRELTRLCADLDGRVLVFGSPQQRSTPPGMTREEARARAVEMFQAWAVTAERLGVTICLEALPADETDQMTTTAEVVEIVTTIDSPAVRMVLDVKSMCAESRPIPELIELAAPYLAYVQANDANRGGPGFGDTDFVPVFRALARVGYDGDVSVEAFDYRPDPVTVATRSLQYLRAAAREAGVVAGVVPPPGRPTSAAPQAADRWE